VAVSGTSVYVTGFFSNNTTNANAVLLGGAGTTPGTAVQNGTSTVGNPDLLLLKYTDNGADAAFVWSQVGGGTADDRGLGLAVSGPSVYVTGYVSNNTADGSAVRFGGAGAAPGTVAVAGVAGARSNDLLLAKYTDNGAAAILA
jgi:hypothetical protein